MSTNVQGVVATLLIGLVTGCPKTVIEVPSAGPTVKVLAEGARLKGANGIMFGPDGQLWVASVVTRVLAVVEPETGEILERIGPDEGVKGPDDLAFGPDGSVYWTDIAFGEVGKRTRDGSSSVIATLGPGVNPITFSDDGRLFVSQCFMGDNLYELDPEGVKEPRLVSNQLGPGCGLNGMDWGADGFLYGPRWFQHEVIKVDVDTGEFTTVARDFGVPAAVKFDSHGRLHVLDTLAGEVVRVDPDTGAREVVGRLVPSSSDNLAFDESDHLFVSSYTDGSIVQVVDSENTRIVSQGGISMPGGVALMGGSLYVADFFALRELDPSSGEERRAIRAVIGFSDLGEVMTVRQSDENLLCTSWFGNTVKLWNPVTEKVVATFDGFVQPIDAVPFDGGIVVSEYGTGSVVRLDRAAPRRRTILTDGLQEPAGLAARGGDLFVADRATGLILQIATEGRVLDPPRVVVSGLAGPEGLDVASDGALYVVEADGRRVSRVDRESGATSVVADNLEIHIPSQGQFPTTMLFNGVAVGEGTIYVTGDIANVVYRIDL